MFAAGDLVVYGGEGVCRVESVGTPDTSGYDKTKTYYTLAPLYRSGQVMTPVDTCVLMRPVMTAQDAAGFLAALPALAAEEPQGQSQRAAREHYHAVVTSYDCGRMAAMIKYVSRRRRWAQKHGRKVSQLDERYLRRRRWALTGRMSAPISGGTIPHGRRIDAARYGYKKRTARGRFFFIGSFPAYRSGPADSPR